MKKKNRIFPSKRFILMGIPSLVILGMFLMVTNSCKKDDTNTIPPVVIQIPVLTTTAVSSITASTANSGGHITSNGGAAITARGVCWSTSSTPTITGSKTTNGKDTGIFTSAMTGLSQSTKYYVRAYATNSAGTGYGNEISFTTPQIPLVSTADISSITSTTATSGGSITIDGGAKITAKGVCWSTNNTPTISDSKTTNGNDTGSFTSSLTGLSPYTTYYVRAYATNIAGTGYGNIISFKTLLQIGDAYQGGKVAYILQSGDPGYDIDVVHGLIAPSTDQSTSIYWWNYNLIVTGASGMVLGTGNANTIAIVNSQGTGNYAAQLCNDLTLNGYSDWYLPSRDELKKLCDNKIAIGGFADADYWSSSEADFHYALYRYFKDNLALSAAKESKKHVRAVRSF